MTHIDAAEKNEYVTKKSKNVLKRHKKYNNK